MARSLFRRASMDSEKDLIEAFESKDFPNPERVDCPGREALTRFAANPADPEFATFFAHIRQCAPCLDELKELRKGTT